MIFPTALESFLNPNFLRCVCEGWNGIDHNKLLKTAQFSLKAFCFLSSSGSSLRCFIVGCNNEHSSRRLLLSFLEGMHQSPICLNVFMFAQIIRDPASSTEEVSIRFFFYESLQIAFPNNVLVSKFCGWSLQSAHHPTEEELISF